jgi:hypothetical protein
MAHIAMSPSFQPVTSDEALDAAEAAYEDPVEASEPVGEETAGDRLVSAQQPSPQAGASEAPLT